MDSNKDLTKSIADFITGLFSNPSIMLYIAIALTITLVVSFSFYVNISNKKNKVTQKTRGNNSPNINIVNGSNFNDKN